MIQNGFYKYKGRNGDLGLKKGQTYFIGNVYDIKSVKKEYRYMTPVYIYSNSGRPTLNVYKNPTTFRKYWEKI